MIHTIAYIPACAERVCREPCRVCMCCDLCACAACSAARFGSDRLRLRLRLRLGPRLGSASARQAALGSARLRLGRLRSARLSARPRLGCIYIELSGSGRVGGGGEGSGGDGGGGDGASGDCGSPVHAACTQRPRYKVTCDAPGASVRVEKAEPCVNGAHNGMGTVRADEVPKGAGIAHGLSRLPKKVRASAQPFGTSSARKVMRRVAGCLTP